MISDSDRSEGAGTLDLRTQLVLRAGHLPSCGDGAEFPWDCTCGYAGFMNRMERLLAEDGLDVERLAFAMHVGMAGTDGLGDRPDLWREAARATAAEYARLIEDPTPSEGNQP